MDNNRQNGILYIVVPCYNEEEALETSAAALLKSCVSCKAELWYQTKVKLYL